MVDVVDSFLNNVVNLYVQAVDYCQISTSKIPIPVDAGTRQIRPESGDVRQTSLDSGDTVPYSGHTGRNLAGAAGSQAIWPDPGPDPARTPDHWPSGRDPGRIRPGSGQNSRTPSIWPDPAVLAESPASPAGILPERRDLGQLAGNGLGRPVLLAGIRPFVPESGKNGQIPATLPEFLSSKY